MNGYVVIEKWDDLINLSYLIWEQILCHVPVSLLSEVTIRFSRDPVEGCKKYHIGQLIWELDYPKCPSCGKELKPQEDKGISYTVGEARAATKDNIMITYHKELILWLCDRIEFLENKE